MVAAAPPVYLHDVAPSLTPPRFGLLSAGELVDWNDPHLHNGVEFMPNPHGEAGVESNDVDDHTAPVLDTEVPTVESGPIRVYAGLELPTTALTPAEAAARARARLSAGEAAKVEKQLWAAAPNPLNVGPEVLTQTALAIDDAVGLLEEWFGERYGGTPVIHAQRRLAVRAVDEHAALRDSGKMVTPLGSAWSFGNYPGTGPMVVPAPDDPDDPDEPPKPAAPLAGRWLIATGQVQIRRSDVEVRSNTLAATLHRTTNTVRVSAHRTYVVSWDGIAAAVPITL